MTDAEAKRAPSPADDDKGLGTHLNELLGLVVAYTKQETLDPLKALGRYVAWGVAGAVLFAIGGGMLTLTAVRVVQSETGRHLTGNLTWVPYLGGVLVAAVGVAWATLRVIKGDKAIGGDR
ncbi:MAG TPA: hypothetical protein VG435_04910 [Acidimicrobiales bacterium]|nr:hypothetical protein [Acidimicrobiales bacterium]